MRVGWNIPLRPGSRWRGRFIGWPQGKARIDSQELSLWWPRPFANSPAIVIPFTAIDHIELASQVMRLPNRLMDSFFIRGAGKPFDRTGVTTVGASRSRQFEALMHDHGVDVRWSGER